MHIGKAQTYTHTDWYAIKSPKSKPSKFVIQPLYYNFFPFCSLIGTPRSTSKMYFHPEYNMRLQAKSQSHHQHKSRRLFKHQTQQIQPGSRKVRCKVKLTLPSIVRNEYARQVSLLISFMQVPLLMTRYHRLASCFPCVLVAQNKLLSSLLTKVASMPANRKICENMR